MAFTSRLCSRPSGQSLTLALTTFFSLTGSAQRPTNILMCTKKTTFCSVLFSFSLLPMLYSANHDSIFTLFFDYVSVSEFRPTTNTATCGDQDTKNNFEMRDKDQENKISHEQLSLP